MEHNTTIRNTMAGVTRDSDFFVFEDYNQRIAIATILCIVFLVGSFGNTLVITAVVFSRKLRSSTNWFVVNLACADLLVCLALPLNIVAMLSRDGWPLPGWICAANSAVILICLGASFTTLAFIAYNRFYLLTRPMVRFRKLYTTTNVCIMVLMAWSFPAILVLASHFAGLYVLGYSYEYKVCMQDSSLPYSDWCGKTAGAVFIIPTFIAIVIIYLRVYIFVCRHSKKMKNSEVSQPRGINNINAEMSTSEMPSMEPNILTNSDIMTQSYSTLNIDTLPQTEGNRPTQDAISSPTHKITENQSSSLDTKPHQTPPRSANQNLPSTKTGPILDMYHVKVTKRLAIVVLAFFICMLPYGVNLVVPHTEPGNPWTGLLLSFNSCVNPFIYARTMPDFRKVMASVICCRLKDMDTTSPTFIMKRTIHQRI